MYLKMQSFTKLLSAESTTPPYAHSPKFCFHWSIASPSASVVTFSRRIVIIILGIFVLGLQTLLVKPKIT